MNGTQTTELDGQDVGTSAQEVQKEKEKDKQNALQMQQLTDSIGADSAKTILTAAGFDGVAAANDMIKNSVDKTSDAYKNAQDRFVKDVNFENTREYIENELQTPDMDLNKDDIAARNANKKQYNDAVNKLSGGNGDYLKGFDKLNGVAQAEAKTAAIDTQEKEVLSQTSPITGQLNGTVISEVIKLRSPLVQGGDEVQQPTNASSAQEVQQQKSKGPSKQ